MPSGNRRLVYNTRERLLSTDHNREQQFLSADVASLLARMYLARYEDDAGVSTLASTVGTPPVALILDGLMFRPIDGSDSALVDAGAVAMIDPDAVPSADDVPAKWIHSDGVPTIGQLVLSPNPGGIRIDVVEFRRVVEDVEFDNRDQFSPSTGLFTPVNVLKVQRGALEFRIRLGVVGSSFPGLAAGWLPIAVCRVPAVATTWDDVTVWDVRPLLCDRWAGGGSNVEKELPQIVRQLVKTDIPTVVSSVGAEQRISGRIEGELLGWRVGGPIRSVVPGTQTDYVDVALTANQEGSGVVFDPTKHWYLYALFPYALPRWTRYGDPGVGGRTPNGPRGLLVVSKTQPAFDGTPTAKVAPPGSTNLQNGTYMAAGTHPAFCLAVGRVSNTSVPTGIVIDGVVARPAIDDFDSQVAGVVGASSTEFTLVVDEQFPDNARAIRAVMLLQITATGAAFYAVPGTFTVSDASGSLTNFWTQMFTGPTTPLRLVNTDAVDVTFEIRIPLEPTFDGSPRSFKVRWDHGTPAANTSVTQALLIPTAWEIAG